MGAVLLVVLDRAGETFFEAHLRRPSSHKIELCPRRVDASDIDNFLFFGERNNAIRPTARCFQEKLNKFFQRIRLLAADIDKSTARLVACACSQESFNGVVNIGEPAQLLSIAKELDFFTADGLLDEPPCKSLLGVLHELSRPVSISEAQRDRRHSIYEVIDHVVPLAGHFVHAIDIDWPETLGLDEGLFFVPA